MLLDGGLNQINETLCFIQILDRAQSVFQDTHTGEMSNNVSIKFRELIYM